MTFKYDAFGRRIYKKVDYPSTNATSDYEEWYVQDASGNELTTYKKTSTETLANQQQIILFAASKVGYYKATTGSSIDAASLRFEIVDHLGSVHAVVTGAKVSDGAGGLKADIMSLTDYYAFGSKARGFVSETEAQQYGFHGMKRDNSVGNDDEDYTTEFRQYDADLGRWLSPDPLMDMYPSHSSYNFNFNNPVNYTDPTGLGPNNWWTKFKRWISGKGKEGDGGVGNNQKTTKKGKKPSSKKEKAHYDKETDTYHTDEVGVSHKLTGWEKRQRNAIKFRNKINGIGRAIGRFFNKSFEGEGEKVKKRPAESYTNGEGTHTKTTSKGDQVKDVDMKDFMIAWSLGTHLPDVTNAIANFFDALTDCFQEIKEVKSDSEPALKPEPVVVKPEVKKEIPQVHIPKRDTTWKINWDSSNHLEVDKIFEDGDEVKP